MAGGVPGGSAPESMGKEAEEDEELTTNPFWGLVWAEDDRRGGSMVRGGATVHGGLVPRFGRGELVWRLGKVEVAVGELLCARDRNKATGGRRSMEWAVVERALLGSV